jgi:hypothetical protein
MHELALAEAAIQTISERTGTAPVGCVRLEIGRQGTEPGAPNGAR